MAWLLTVAAHAQHYEPGAEKVIEIDSVDFTFTNYIWPRMIECRKTYREGEYGEEIVDSTFIFNTYESKIYRITNHSDEPYLMWFINKRYGGKPLKRILQRYIYLPYGPYGCSSLGNLIHDPDSYQRNGAANTHTSYIGGNSLIELRPGEVFTAVLIYALNDGDCSYRDNMVFVSRKGVEDFLKAKIDDYLIFQENIVVINNLCSPIEPVNPTADRLPSIRPLSMSANIPEAVGDTAVVAIQTDVSGPVYSVCAKVSYDASQWEFAGISPDEIANHPRLSQIVMGAAEGRGQVLVTVSGHPLCEISGDNTLLTLNFRRLKPGRSLFRLEEPSIVSSPVHFR